MHPLNSALMWAAVTETDVPMIESAQWRTWPADIRLCATLNYDEAVAAAGRIAGKRGAGFVVRLKVE